MTTYGLCCSPVGAGGTSTGASMVNVGGQFEVYVNGSSAPFELRTLQSPTGTVGFTQNATTLDVDSLDSIANLGSGAEWYVAGSRLPFNFRSLTTDGTIAITQSATEIQIASNILPASSVNIGTGIDIYQGGSFLPFNFHRVEVIDDGSDIHGSGNLAFWQDTANNTAKIDLPRGHFQSNAVVNTNNVLVTLIDVTFGDDSAGANVAGKNGEDWIVWWSCKVCGDPGQPLVDQVMRLRSHDGAVWTIQDTVHTRWTVGITPSSPVTRPYLLTNTNWSGNGGLRLSIEVATNNFAVFNDFEHPSIHIQRFNK